MSNTGKALRLVLVVLFLLIPFCLSAAGIAETYKCGEAAEMLRTNADAYRDPVPTVEEILGGLSPYAPLTRMDGCEMLLRAFGPPELMKRNRLTPDCIVHDIEAAIGDNL